MHVICPWFLWNHPLIMPLIHHLKTSHHSAPQCTLYSIKIGSDPQSQYKTSHVPVMNTLMLQELCHAIWLNINVIQILTKLFPDKDGKFNTEVAFQHNPQLANSLVWQASLCEPNSNEGPTGTGETAEFKVTNWLNKISTLFGACSNPNSLQVSPDIYLI